MLYLSYVFFFFKQKTAYEMRISDWSSDVCSSDLRLHLLGDRDAMPRPDESREIGFGRMDGNAAHRHRRPAMLAARRQRDVERRCGRLCIVEEQLEEIAHAIEEQAIARPFLERPILRHHRRCGPRGGRSGVAVRGFLGDRGHPPLLSDWGRHGKTE